MAERARRIRNFRAQHDQPEHPAGVEPALSPWQGNRLPLHHGRCWQFQIVKDRQQTLSLLRKSASKDRVADSEHRAGVEPALPLYESGILATRRPVLFRVFISSGTGGT